MTTLRIRAAGRGTRLPSLVLAVVVTALALLISLPVTARGAAHTPSAFAAVTADQARSFDVDFDVEEDGSVVVTERISWEFPSGEQRRGIERLVVTSVGYQDREDVFRRYQISDISASSPTGAPADVNVTELGGTTRLRIGSERVCVGRAGLRRLVSPREGHQRHR